MCHQPQPVGTQTAPKFLISTCFYKVGVSSWSFKKGVISPTFLWQVRTVKLQKNHKSLCRRRVWQLRGAHVIHNHIHNDLWKGRCGWLWLWFVVVVVVVCCGLLLLLLLLLLSLLLLLVCWLLLVVCCSWFFTLSDGLTLTLTLSLSRCLFVATQWAKHVCQPENLSQMSGWISKKLPPTLPETNSKNA